MHHLAASGCSCVFMRQGIASFSVRIMQMAPRKQPLCMSSLAHSASGCCSVGPLLDSPEAATSKFCAHKPLTAKLLAVTLALPGTHACLMLATFTSHGSKPESMLLLQADPDSPGTILHQGGAGAGEQARHCAC